MKWLKIWLGVLSITMATDALATTWQKFPSDFADEKGLYIDTDSIMQDTADERSFLLKRTYHQPQPFDATRQYVAQFVQVRVNCQKQTFISVATAFYDAQFNQLANIAHDKPVWQNAKSHSGVAKRLDFVCQYQ